MSGTVESSITRTEPVTDDIRSTDVISPSTTASEIYIQGMCRGLGDAGWDDETVVYVSDVANLLDSVELLTKLDDLDRRDAVGLCIVADLNRDESLYERLYFLAERLEKIGGVQRADGTTGNVRAQKAALRAIASAVEISMCLHLQANEGELAS